MKLEYEREDELASLWNHGTPSSQHLPSGGHRSTGDKLLSLHTGPPCHFGVILFGEIIVNCHLGINGDLASFKSLQRAIAKVRKNILPIMLQFSNNSIWARWLNGLQENAQAIILNTKAIMSGATSGTHKPPLPW